MKENILVGVRKQNKTLISIYSCLKHRIGEVCKIDRFGGEAWEGVKQQSGGEYKVDTHREREREREKQKVTLF